jgi:hypothetical protein
MRKEQYADPNPDFSHFIGGSQTVLMWLNKWIPMEAVVRTMARSKEHVSSLLWISRVSNT